MTWAEATLEELCEINVGRTPARASPTYWGAGEPWLSIADMNQGRVIRSTKEQITPLAASAGHLVEPGTVLLSFKLSIGKVALAGIPLYTNEAIAALPIRRPDLLLPEFLMRALESQDLAGVSNRAAMGATLNKAKLKQIRIPLPPLDEQRRIAAILGQMDDLETKRRMTIELTTDLERSLFADMFGSRIAGANRVPLKSIATLITKGTTPTSVGLAFANSGVPFVRVQNLADGLVRFGDGDLYIDPISHSKLGRSQIRPRDVLISIAGTIGRCAVVPENAPEMNCNQAVAIVRLADPILGRWLLAWLATDDAVRQMTASSVTATISNLSLTQIGALQVPEPLASEAATFNRVLAAVDQARAGLAHSQSQLSALADGLKHCVFAAA